MSRRCSDPRPLVSRRIAALAVLAAAVGLGACAGSGTRPSSDAAAGRDVAAGRNDAGRAAAASLEVPEDVPDAVRRSFDAALAALAAERWAEAETELEAIAREYPGYPGPHVNLAIVYRRDGREADARAALEAALAADPNHAQANNELGIELRRAGEFEAAEAAYRRALESDPDYAIAHYNLGVLLDLYLHRGREALAHYERYQRLAAEPDRAVAGWIIDLRRRLDIPANESARVAQEDGT